MHIISIVALSLCCQEQQLTALDAAVMLERLRWLPGPRPPQAAPRSGWRHLAAKARHHISEVVFGACERAHVPQDLPCDECAADEEDALSRRPANRRLRTSETRRAAKVVRRSDICVVCIVRADGRRLCVQPHVEDGCCSGLTLRPRRMAESTNNPIEKTRSSPRSTRRSVALMRAHGWVGREGGWP